MSEAPETITELCQSCKFIRECVDCGRHVVAKDLEQMERQIAEIHQFMTGIANALNSPMVKSMLPANLRGMI